MTDDDGNHARFLEHLDRSKPAVWFVAQWLVARGNEVTVKPNGRAPTREDALDYQDEGDLRIALRCEVKQRDLNFTCAADFPYPDFIVCAVHSFDLAIPKPVRFYYVNRAMTHGALVHCRDHSRWTQRALPDSRYAGVRQNFYIAPLDSVTFFPYSQKNGGTEVPPSSPPIAPPVRL